MKPHQFYIFLLVLFAGLAACNSTQKQNNNTNKPLADNSRTSVDWEGIYQGILPCADCKGIKTQLELKKDLSYVLETKYLGKKDSVFRTEGSFVWNDKGSIITLDGTNKQNYLVGENQLFHLDKKGNKISGDLSEKYILKKESVELWDKYWKLVLLNGKPARSRIKEAYIMFDKAENRFHGNASCNNYVGKYELNENQITFENPLMTKIACKNMDIEIVFLKFLEVVTNYSITENELILKDTDGTDIIHFQSVYFN